MLASFPSVIGVISSAQSTGSRGLTIGTDESLSSESSLSSHPSHRRPSDGVSDGRYRILLSSIPRIDVEHSHDVRRILSDRRRDLAHFDAFAMNPTLGLGHGRSRGDGVVGKIVGGGVG